MFILQETRQTVEAEHDFRLHGTWLVPSREWQVGVSPADAALTGGPGTTWGLGTESVTMALSRKWISCNHLLLMSREREPGQAHICTQRNSTWLEIPGSGALQMAGVSKSGQMENLEDKGEHKGIDD